jgi:hypothetical protein
VSSCPEKKGEGSRPYANDVSGSLTLDDIETTVYPFVKGGRQNSDFLCDDQWRVSQSLGGLVGEYDVAERTVRHAKRLSS